MIVHTLLVSTEVSVMHCCWFHPIITNTTQPTTHAVYLCACLVLLLLLMLLQRSSHSQKFHCCCRQPRSHAWHPACDTGSRGAFEFVLWECANVLFTQPSRFWHGTLPWLFSLCQQDIHKQNLATLCCCFCWHTLPRLACCVVERYAPTHMRLLFSPCQRLVCCCCLSCRPLQEAVAVPGIHGLCCCCCWW